MKVYKSTAEQTKKSWSIKLTDDAEIVAVDAVTGEHIAHLIEFIDNGRVLLLRYAEEIIRENGYDPYEHDNSFDEYGRIIISND